MLPWTDRTGRFAPLKCAAFAGVLVPAAWIVIEASFGWLGERPIMEAIHQSGLWAVRLLAVTLAVTPLRLALALAQADFDQANSRRLGSGLRAPAFLALYS